MANGTSRFGTGITDQAQTIEGDKTFTGNVEVSGHLRSSQFSGVVDSASPSTLLTVSTGIDIAYRVEIIAIGGAALTSAFVTGIARQRTSGSHKATFIYGSSTFGLDWSGQDLRVTSSNANVTSFMVVLTKLY